MKAPAGVTALPGMAANVRITTRGNHGLEKLLVVPISAVSKQSTGEQVVWILGADQTVHRRTVTLGAPTADQVKYSVAWNQEIALLWQVRPSCTKG
jgi:multidrug efflux pump subunit AcrA (membrane-fusion protein)